MFLEQLVDVDLKNTIAHKKHTDDELFIKIKTITNHCNTQEVS
jgi:hypothetical protein